MAKKNGFTLVELMIVIAIIGIIAALAIANLMTSRIRANEATSITALKNYATAQTTYHIAKLGRATTNTPGTAGATAFCTNYRNLFYGNPIAKTNAIDPSQNIQLISLAHADAYIGDDWLIGATNSGVPLTAATAPVPYQGYQFGNPRDGNVTAAFFDTTFALIATPSNSSSTGNNIYWISLEGTVYMQGLNSGLAATVTGMTATPSQSGVNPFLHWLSL